MTEPTQLIFLPGSAGKPEFWHPVSNLLASRATRTFLSWPGFGGSPPDPKVQEIDDLVDMVVAKLDQPSALIAQSMGGVVALKTALRKPERITHLVLAATAGGVNMTNVYIPDWRTDFLLDNPTAPTCFCDYTEDMSEFIATIEIPSLLLWGKRDPISPISLGRKFQKKLPKTTMHIIACSGHDFANKCAEQVAPLVDAHLIG